MADKIHAFPREEATSCDLSNEYDGRLGLRVSSIFVILVGSTCGALLPIILSKHPKLAASKWFNFFFRYFGSGVIIATAYIHLLAPAIEALSDPCLSGVITEYVWVEGIILMSIFALFFVELLVTRYGRRSMTRVTTESLGHGAVESPSPVSSGKSDEETTQTHVERGNSYYGTQIASILILEFGVIFHSIFIGLTLAVAGEEFTTLYIVITFHQTFEGLGLGSRLASTPWPKSKSRTPYILAVAYGITTPIAIAIGLAFKASYPPSAETTLLLNGVFDSISAGILIYVGCIELMGQELLPGSVMLDAPVQIMLSAFGLMALGAGLMALLGKWA